VSGVPSGILQQNYNKIEKGLELQEIEREKLKQEIMLLQNEILKNREVMRD